MQGSSIGKYAYQMEGIFISAREKYSLLNCVIGVKTFYGKTYVQLSNKLLSMYSSLNWSGPSAQLWYHEVKNANKHNSS